MYAAVAFNRDGANGDALMASQGIMTVISAHGLKLSFGGQTVLDGIDLDLKKGEVVLLRGDNGSGKTTLLNVLTGNLRPDRGTIRYLADGTPRTYRFPRRWWQELNPFDHFTPEFVAREGIGRTWQDIRLFRSQSLVDNIAVAAPRQVGENPVMALFAPRHSDRRDHEINRDAALMLARIGLIGRGRSRVDEVSLGQAKRVAIARAVSSGAKVLFLDEPLAGLDLKGIKEIVALLRSLVANHDITMVIIEHVLNQQHLHSLITTDWLLAGGRLQRAGGGGRRPDTDGGVACALLASEYPEVTHEKLTRSGHLTRIRNRTAAQEGSQPVLQIRDLVVNRGGGTVIGRDHDGATKPLNLVLHAGETALLQAPNGWGKTTLFSAICGFTKIAQGEILLNGQSLGSMPPWARVKAGLCAFRADFQGFPNLNVREALRLANVREAALPLAAFLARMTSSLSGGEKQSLNLLGRQYERGVPALLLFDEPFSMLDEAAIRRAASLMTPHPSRAVLITIPSSIVSA
jgi:ABC-type branched-subunit amino acid transport system ATPase component